MQIIDLVRCSCEVTKQCNSIAGLEKKSYEESQEEEEEQEEQKIQETTH